DSKVLAKTRNGRKTKKLIAKPRPQISLLDLTMPELNGFEVLERTCHEFREVSVIVLTVHEGEEYALRALKLGAMGYLPKSAASTEIELAIMTVLSNEKYVSPELSRR